MKRLDLWLGKNLFQPPIIRLCQLTGMTQYAVHRYLWWVVTLYFIWRLESDDHWLWKTTLILLGVAHTINAGLEPDRPLGGSDLSRRLLLWLMAIDTIIAALTVRIPSPALLGMLFAEYALTIKTIPPRKTKEAAVKSRRVEA